VEKLGNITHLTLRERKRILEALIVDVPRRLEVRGRLGDERRPRGASGFPTSSRLGMCVAVQIIEATVVDGSLLPDEQEAKLHDCYDDVVKHDLEVRLEGNVHDKGRPAESFWGIVRMCRAWS
jgi:hypothetical protein